MTQQTIRIEGLVAHAIIGIYEHEKQHEQPLRLDIEVLCDATPVLQSGRIEDAVDYDTLARGLVAYVQSKPHQLLEVLVDELLQQVIDHPHACEVMVAIRKPQALEALGAEVCVSGRRVKG